MNLFESLNKGLEERYGLKECDIAECKDGSCEGREANKSIKGKAPRKFKRVAGKGLVEENNMSKLKKTLDANGIDIDKVPEKREEEKPVKSGPIDPNSTMGKLSKTLKKESGVDIEECKDGSCEDKKRGVESARIRRARFVEARRRAVRRTLLKEARKNGKK